MQAATRTVTFTESVIREMTRIATMHQAVNLAQGFPGFPDAGADEGGGVHRDPRRHQSVRRHLGHARAAAGDRREVPAVVRHGGRSRPRTSP